MCVLGGEQGAIGGVNDTLLSAQVNFVPGVNFFLSFEKSTMWLLIVLLFYFIIFPLTIYLSTNSMYFCFCEWSHQGLFFFFGEGLLK